MLAIRLLDLLNRSVDFTESRPGGRSYSLDLAIQQEQFMGLGREEGERMGKREARRSGRAGGQVG